MWAVLRSSKSLSNNLRGWSPSLGVRALEWLPIILRRSLAWDTKKEKKIEKTKEEKK